MPYRIARLNITTGIIQPGQLKNITPIKSGTPMDDQENGTTGAEGAAWAAIRLDEWLSVVESPAHRDPENDPYTDLRLERPVLCPDS